MITIIILLILAGIALNFVLGEGGIIERAVTATKKYDIAGAKEQVEVLAANYISNYYDDKYINGKSVSNKIGDYVAENLKREKNVGDYDIKTTGTTVIISKGDNKAAGEIMEDGSIDWNCWTQDKTKVTKGEIELTVGAKITGYEANGVTDWYILGAKNGKLLLTTNTNLETVTLSRKAGYEGGVAKLKTVADKYVDTDRKYAYEVRTIDVEDINRVTGYDPDVSKYNDGTNNTNQWGNNVTYTLKNGYIYYKGTKYPIPVEGEDEDGIQSSSTSFEYYNGSEWIKLGVGTNPITSMIVAHDYYYYYPKTLTTSNSGDIIGIAEDSLAYLLLFDNTIDANCYWLGSPCVYCEKGFVGFGFRMVDNEHVDGGFFYDSEGYGGDAPVGFRAVVALKSDIKITKINEEQCKIEEE